MNILPTRNRGSERDTWRALVGLEGDFEAAGRSFYWSVTARRGQSTGHVEVFDSYATHPNNAPDSVRANGELVCRITSAHDPTKTRRPSRRARVCQDEYLPVAAVDLQTKIRLQRQITVNT